VASEDVEMLKIGDSLPEFQATATDGTAVSTAGLKGKPVVLFFFPKAFTPGCVRETKAFRDEYPSLARRGVQIIGVSTDPLDAQCRFAEWAGVPFPLIADASGTIAKQFGVLRPLLSIAKRVTFVADAETIVRHVFHYELRVDRHVADVRRVVDDLFSGAA
jgi:thioredoxin-dependent peroxiredoxin